MYIRHTSTVKPNETMANGFKIASVAECRSAKPSRAQQLDLARERVEAMDFANRERSFLKRSPASKRKSVRFTAKIDGEGFHQPAGVPAVPGVDLHDSTHDHSTLEPKDQLSQGELLMPVCYSLPSKNKSGSEHSTLSNDSLDNVKPSLERIEGPYVLPESDFDQPAKPLELTVETDPYRNHTRNTSSISGRGRRDSHQFEIYFTPIDYTRSQIFLSSPVPSQELPRHQSEDACLTPKASMSRPPSAIFVGSDPVFSEVNNVKKEKLSITSAQLDQLIEALASSKLIQNHVRKQSWDSADIPDDESVFSASSRSPRPLKSAFAIYSQPNETFLEDEPTRHSPDHPRARRSLPVPPAQYGGISLLDSRTYGSPVRFTSRDYRQGFKVLGIGSNAFLNLPYGTDVECTLRVEPVSAFTATCKVMLQAINQGVDRKTSKRALLLAADVEVTDLFARAALTELAEATGTSLEDITVQPSTITTPDGSDIDWCALADEMQDTADTSQIIEIAVQGFSALNSETCAMRTLALMSELERIRDQHMDFLIVVPTKFHENGMPSNMRMPWISQRLYNDWYGTKDGPGFSETAKEFQQDVVANVAKRAVAKENFTTSIAWKEVQQVVHCVPLRDGERGEGAAWVCFIRGEFDLQS